VIDHLAAACYWDSLQRIRTGAARGVGTGLLKHALQRCVTAAGLIGRRALIVNAVDAEAAAFWGRRGFIPSKDDPLVLFRSIADIAASLR
jgi:GNAT superfamily N-acetyltransferase